MGTAGYAALLIFFRALVKTEVTVADTEAVDGEIGLLTFLVVWIGAFYIGELLLAVSLVRAGTGAVPRWIPSLLLLHVASIVLLGAPDWVGKAAVVLSVLPSCGLAMRVMQVPVQGSVRSLA